jgi:hypothetical protein
MPEYKEPVKMKDKKMSCLPLVKVLEEKLRTHRKGILRKWIKCKIRELRE